jgi:hypothetical protein
MDSPCLSNEHCRLVELLQVAKQLRLDFGSVWPYFLLQDCKFQASCEDMECEFENIYYWPDFCIQLIVAGLFQVPKITWSTTYHPF